MIYAGLDLHKRFSVITATTTEGRELVTVMLHLRYLQTLTEIATEKNRTLVFHLPIGLFKMFM